jgi:sugar lactone lactonase YvrE
VIIMGRPEHRSLPRGLVRGLLGGAAAVSLVVGAAAGPAAGEVLTPDSTIATIAGSVRGYGGDAGPALAALLNEPRDTDVGPDGTVYVADTFNSRIRAIAPDGTITTIAGTGSTVYNGDDIPATSASLYWPHDVTVDDATGVVYLADSNHHRIRRVTADGVITTIAGTGKTGSSGDGGLATRARIKNPKSVALFGGALYFASLENKVRRVDLTTGVITTVAGTGALGYTGDGGPATRATLSSPQRLAIDSVGNIYVADTGNSVVRRIDAVTGVITTVAGTGTAAFGGNGGPATLAQLKHPRGLALAGDDVLYVADSDNHRVRVVDLVTGVIGPVAGRGKGFSGDGGPAGQAQLFQPRGLTTLPDGGLLVADTFNDRLRVISPPPPVVTPPELGVAAPPDAG